MSTYEQAPRRGLSLAQQIFIGMALGGLIGWLQPAWGTSLFFLRDIFLNLIKSIIAPLVFSTIVVGIAGSGSARNVGRMGLRSLLYFEVVTTLALVIGLVVVNITQPGVGIMLNGTSDAVQTIAQTQPKTLIQTLVHVFPASIVDALLRGDVLQIVAFSILFGFGIGAVGEAAAADDGRAAQLHPLRDPQRRLLDRRTRRGAAGACSYRTWGDVS